jgi:hypothetical protein
MPASETHDVKRTINRIDLLRRKVGKSRSQGRSIEDLTAFDFEIIGNALELLRETVNAAHAMSQVTPDE